MWLKVPYRSKRGFYSVCSVVNVFVVISAKKKKKKKKDKEKKNGNFLFNKILF